MKHFTNPSFHECYNRLPRTVQKLADKNFELLKSDPNYPSLHLKKVGKYWSIRIGKSYRALAVEVDKGLIWFWVGSHAEYDRLLKKQRYVDKKDDMMLDVLGFVFQCHSSEGWNPVLKRLILCWGLLGLVTMTQHDLII